MVKSKNSSKINPCGSYASNPAVSDHSAHPVPVRAILVALQPQGEAFNRLMGVGTGSSLLGLTQALFLCEVL